MSDLPLVIILEMQMIDKVKTLTISPNQKTAALSGRRIFRYIRIEEYHAEKMLRDVEEKRNNIKEFTRAGVEVVFGKVPFQTAVAIWCCEEMSVYVKDQDSGGYQKTEIEPIKGRDYFIEVRKDEQT